MGRLSLAVAHFDRALGLSPRLLEARYYRMIAGMVRGLPQEGSEVERYVEQSFDLGTDGETEAVLDALIASDPVGIRSTKKYSLLLSPYTRILSAPELAKTPTESVVWSSLITASLSRLV